MPSFDIVSKVEAQALDNAVNVTQKEITNRFDFKGSHVVIDLDKKEFLIKLETDDDMKMRQLIDVLISRAHKQGIAPEAFDASKEGAQSGKVWKKNVKVKNGLAQEDAIIETLVSIVEYISKEVKCPPLFYRNWCSYSDTHIPELGNIIRS